MSNWILLMAKVGKASSGMTLVWPVVILKVPGGLMTEEAGAAGEARDC